MRRQGDSTPSSVLHARSTQTRCSPAAGDGSNPADPLRLAVCLHSRRAWPKTPSPQITHLVEVAAPLRRPGQRAGCHSSRLIRRCGALLQARPRLARLLDQCRRLGRASSHSMAPARGLDRRSHAVSAAAASAPRAADGLRLRRHGSLSDHSACGLDREAHRTARTLGQGRLAGLPRGVHPRQSRAEAAARRDRCLRLRAQPICPGLFDEIRKTLPQPLPASAQAKFQPTASGFALTVLTGSKEAAAQFFPFDQNQIDNPAPQTVTPLTRGVRIELKKDQSLKATPPELHGLLVLGRWPLHTTSRPLRELSPVRPT